MGRLIINSLWAHLNHPKELKVKKHKMQNQAKSSKNYLISLKKKQIFIKRGPTRMKNC